MSMQLDEAIKVATSALGPVAVALIRDRDYEGPEDFLPFYGVLTEELESFVRTVTRLTENNEPFRCDDHKSGWSWVGLIQTIGYGKPIPTNVKQQQPILAPAKVGTTPTLEVTGTCQHHGDSRKGGFSTNASGIYEFHCGYKCNVYSIAMAHKVLHHNYRHHKYTEGWARDEYAKYGTTVVTSPSQGVVQPLPDPDPKLIVQTNFSTPTRNLDLLGLGLQPGIASRFAAGEQHNARFYFIRFLNREQKIEGQFVWTKFAHRFNWETAYPGDFIVRKLAGDTKEWVGIQKVQGVINPAWGRRYDPATRGHVEYGGSRYHHENVYVGSHEDDIEEILADPNKARINYGLWRQECGYCGRNLTDAESRARGIGPDCWKDKYLPSLLVGRP